MPIKTIDKYISAFPQDIQKRLQKMRGLIHKNAPGAEEAMAYGIPTFKFNGNLVHFAGYEKHIGFYPAPSGIAAFKDQLSDFTFAKGSVQFPNDKPLPDKLIAEIVKFRVWENKEKK